jgi:hypothetical protein
MGSVKLVNNSTDTIGLADIDIDKHSMITYAIPDEWKDYVKQEIDKAVKPDVNINNLSAQQIILEPNQYYIHFKAFLGTNIKNVGKYIYRIINAETTDCDNICNQLIVYENIIDKKIWARNIFDFTDEVDRSKYPEIPKFINNRFTLLNKIGYDKSNSYFESINHFKDESGNTFIFKVYKNGNYCRSEMTKED